MSIGSFSGLASGIQWRDLVDQIMSLEAARRLTPVTTQVTAAQKRREAWNSFNTVLGKLSDSGKALRDGTAFGMFNTSVSNSASTGRALLTATASSAAVPGTYKVEVLDLARNEKLSGSVVSSTSTALNVTGEFLVNGKTVNIASTDTLASVRDKINAVNSGSTPTGVTASILSTGTDQFRLVLTSDNSGSDGVELANSSGTALQSLGLLDSSATTANTTADGATQSFRMSSTVTAVATMLGVTAPPAQTTVKVGGKVISIDLAKDSLTDIMDRIAAAGVQAETVAETVGGNTVHRLVVSGDVTVDPAATSTADSQKALELLGFAVGGRSSVQQVLGSDNVFTNSVGASITDPSATLLTDVRTNGSTDALADGDTITIRGKRGDGTAVDISYSVTATSTMQDLIDKVNNATNGYGSGSRTAVASFDTATGKIKLTDGTGGDSQLSLSLSASSPDGVTLSFGGMGTTTVGRQREVVAGSNASVRVDGVLLSRASNTITDALTGITMNLQQAEVGTTVDLSVTRDQDGMVKAAQKFASAYNEVVRFIDKQRSDPKEALYASGALRSMFSNVKNVLLTEVGGLSADAPYTRGAAVGIALSKTGMLEVDAAKLKEALSTNLNDVKALFSTAGSATHADVSYSSATAATVPGKYAVNITAAATQASVTGSGFLGTYVDVDAADTMTIADAYTGKSGNIQLANGDSLSTIIKKLNDLFQDQGMELVASDSGGQLKVAGKQYGSTPTFTVSYTAGGLNDGTAQLGLAAGTYAGTDVQGTIGGLAATGSGRLLTGATGGNTEGLVIKYTGTATGAMGDVSYSLGIAGMMQNTIAPLARAGDGVIATQVSNLDTSITKLNLRADDVEARLEVRREQLIRQFTRMEAAMSKLQSQGSWLTSQLQALQPRNG